MERAINPISSAYLETCRFLEQNSAYDFPIPSQEEGAESKPVQQKQERPSAMQEPAQVPAKTPVHQTGQIAADVFNLNGGGQVSMLLPSTLSRTEYEDLKDWLELMARRAERRVTTDEDDDFLN